MTPLRALWTSSVLVLMTMPSPQGMAQEATGLGSLLHLDQTHAAIGRNRQPFVIAEARDFDADLFAGLQHGCTRLDLDLDPVNR